MPRYDDESFWRRQLRMAAQEILDAGRPRLIEYVADHPGEAWNLLVNLLGRTEAAARTARQGLPAALRQAAKTWLTGMSPAWKVGSPASSAGAGWAENRRMSWPCQTCRRSGVRYLANDPRHGGGGTLVCPVGHINPYAPRQSG